MYKTKEEWFGAFRNKADQYLNDVVGTRKNRKQKSDFINTGITDFRTVCVAEVLMHSKENEWTNETLLNEILMVYYVSYVVMLCYVCCVYDTYRPVHAVFCLITALIVISFSENVNAFRPTFHDIIRHLSENINKKSCYSPPITVETTTFH